MSASSLLAEQLPKIIDALSPQGEVSPQANNDLLSAGMELLKGKLFQVLLVQGLCNLLTLAIRN